MLDDFDFADDDEEEFDDEWSDGDLSEVDPGAHFGGRSLQIAELVQAGWKTKDIMADLGVSESRIDDVRARYLSYALGA